ncbi:hypothetical protein JTB14_030353 [Gonioctena quinquepunctata]|nr:hypothetical protein JTB14_030353 [Gonioctena quinquepunctata]
MSELHIQYPEHDFFDLSSYNRVIIPEYSENPNTNGIIIKTILEDYQESMTAYTDASKMEAGAKTDELLANEKLWLDAEKLWLMHRGGFAGARKESGSDQEQGKLKIRLESTGEILCVDEDDIEKANPPPVRPSRDWRPSAPVIAFAPCETVRHESVLLGGESSVINPWRRWRLFGK